MKMSKGFEFIVFLFLCFIELLIVLYVFGCGIVLSPLQKIIWASLGLWVAIVLVRRFMRNVPPKQKIVEGFEALIACLGLLLIIAIGLIMLFVGLNALNTTTVLLLIIIMFLV